MSEKQDLLARYGKEQSGAVSEAGARTIGQKLARASDLILEIASLEERLAEKKKQLYDLEMRELPALFVEYGIDSYGVPARGNEPGYDVEMKPFFSASMPRGEKERREALRLVEKRKGGALIRATFTIGIEKGDIRRAKMLEKFLKKEKLEYDSRLSIHGSTYRAFVRRETLAGRPFSPAELETLGAYAGSIVKLKRRKEENHGVQD